MCDVPHHNSWSIQFLPFYFSQRHAVIISHSSLHEMPHWQCSQYGHLYWHLCDSTVRLFKEFVCTLILGGDWLLRHKFY